MNLENSFWVTFEFWDHSFEQFFNYSALMALFEQMIIKKWIPFFKTHINSIKLIFNQIYWSSSFMLSFNIKIEEDFSSILKNFCEEQKYLDSS